MPVEPRRQREADVTKKSRNSGSRRTDGIAAVFAKRGFHTLGIQRIADMDRDPLREAGGDEVAQLVLVPNVRDDRMAMGNQSRQHAKAEVAGSAKE